MTQKWDDIKNKIEKFASTAVDKAGEFSRDAAEKAEQLTKHGKIKIDIFHLEKSKDKEYQKLGKIIFSQTNNGTIPDLNSDEDIKKTIKKIDNINTDIKIEQEKLDILNKQKEDAHNNKE